MSLFPWIVRLAILTCSLLRMVEPRSEEIAKEHPESVKRLHIDALEDFDIEAATKMAESIGFYHADVNQAAQILLKMWQCFKENDATLVEINPLAKIGDPDDESSKTLCALDAKISLDDNAAFRHDGWKRFADPVHVDPFEQKAREHGLHYVHLQVPSVSLATVLVW